MKLVSEINKINESGLNKLLKQEINKSIVCPHCNATNVIKFGKYNFVQRYKCKNTQCLKTFSEKTNSFWAYSKKEYKMWKRYVELMFLGTTIRGCAKELKINIATAFYWRRKILESLVNINEVIKLKEHVEMSKLMIKENFKGQKNIIVKEREIINIVSAIDNEKNIISTPISKSFLPINVLKTKIYSKICKDAYVNSIGDRILNIAATKHNTTIKKDKESYNRTSSNFNFMIKRWLLKFNGVASKYINTYLSWFITNSKNNILDIDIFITNLHNTKSFKKCIEFSKSELFGGYYY